MKIIYILIIASCYLLQNAVGAPQDVRNLSNNSGITLDGTHSPNKLISIDNYKHNAWFITVVVFITAAAVVIIILAIFHLILACIKNCCPEQHEIEQTCQRSNTNDNYRGLNPGSNPPYYYPTVCPSPPPPYPQAGFRPEFTNFSVPSAPPLGSEGKSYRF